MQDTSQDNTQVTFALQYPAQYSNNVNPLAQPTYP